MILSLIIIDSDRIVVWTLMIYLRHYQMMKITAPRNKSSKKISVSFKKLIMIMRSQLEIIILRTVTIKLDDKMRKIINMMIILAVKLKITDWMLQKWPSSFQIIRYH